MVIGNAVHVYAQRQISIWLLPGQTRTTRYILAENDTKKKISPHIREDLGTLSTHSVKDATINALCKALERCVVENPK